MTEWASTHKCFNSFTKTETFSHAPTNQAHHKRTFYSFFTFQQFFASAEHKKPLKKLSILGSSALINEIVQLIGETTERTFSVFHCDGETFSASFFHKIKHFEASFKELFLFSAFSCCLTYEEGH